MPSLEHLDSAILPTEYGEFKVHVFVDTDADLEILVLSYGSVNKKHSVLTRIHSSCLTGDTLGSMRCDCGKQLRLAMRLIAQEKLGLLIYLPQEGRGIGLANKIRAYALQDQGKDTVEANLLLGFEPDARHYDICADIFAYFELNHLRLLSNNPHKVQVLNDLGFKVERIALQTPADKYNSTYLQTKRDRLGHLLDL